MQIIKDSSDLECALAQWAAKEESLALVPTMGALHEGHLALIAEGKKRFDRVAATIFVNPLQFNDASDLQIYPRTEAADLAKLDEAGCDLAWMPTADQIYPEGFATSVHVDGVSKRWEGEHRPGHFDGVATVVAKLLIASRPTAAIFGEKDWQQLAVIRRMVGDLGLSVEIIGVPTEREDDGLALSSRNARLSPEERAQATALPLVLDNARRSINAGHSAGATLAEAREHLLTAGFSRVDYIALVDGASLEPLDAPAPGARLIAAAAIGSTRLIDNLALD